MSQKDRIVQREVIADIGEDIGLQEGRQMVAKYYRNNGSVSPQIVGRKILQKILDQPDCQGIAIQVGLNEDGESKFVLVGVDGNGKSILQYDIVNKDGKLETQAGIVADRLLRELLRSIGLDWF